MKHLLIIVIISSIVLFTGYTNYDRIEAINLELRSNNEALENSISKLESELQLKLSEISTLKSRISEYKKQVIDYTNEIDKITQNISTFEASKYSINHKNPFNDKDINILDSVGELILTDKKTNKYMDEVSLLQFKGAMITSGTFTHRGDGMTEFSSNQIAFYPDENSSVHFPMVNGDHRTLWFILNNYDKVKDSFGDRGNSGRATIIIDNYKIDLRHIETANSADLVHVITVDEKSQQR